MRIAILVVLAALSGAVRAQLPTVQLTAGMHAIQAELANKIGRAHV